MVDHEISRISHSRHVSRLPGSPQQEQLAAEARDTLFCRLDFVNQFFFEANVVAAQSTFSFLEPQRSSVVAGSRTPTGSVKTRRGCAATAAAAWLSAERKQEGRYTATRTAAAAPSTNRRSGAPSFKNPNVLRAARLGVRARNSSPGGFNRLQD